MKSFLLILSTLFSISSFAGQRKCVVPQIDVPLNSKHEISKAVRAHETKISERNVFIKNLKLSLICEEDNKGSQIFEVEYSYKNIDEYGCTAEVEIKKQEVIKVRSLCEV